MTNGSLVKTSFVVLLSLLLSGAISQAAVIDAWALGDGEKVFRYEEDHPSKAKNSIWNGRRISLRGLYNEVLAFQVIVVADSLGAKGVEIAVDPPVHQSAGVAMSSGGMLYGPGGTVELFSQHYLRVRRPTKPQWFYGSEASAPEKMTGWIPDALIPTDARTGRGGFPLDIQPTRQEVNRRQNTLEINPRQAAQNQGFWVDLYLPRDRRWPAGVYTSTVRVSENGAEVRRIPLSVELLPARLPDENHSNIWLYAGVGTIKTYLPELSDEEAEKMLKFISHRHRADLVGGSDAHRNPFDQADMDSYKGWLDGSAFTPANGYHGPGEGEGEKLFSVGMYGAITDRVMNSMENTRAESDKWVSWFEKNAPDVTYFWYMIDEPGKVQFPWIKEHADWVHSNPGPGKRLPVFTTRQYTPELDEAIDIWAGGHGVDLEALPKLKQQGKNHWFYNGSRPRYGSVILEAEAVDLRVNAWVKYLYGVDTWFLWHGNHWQHNSQGPKGRLHQRVFTEPLTFISWGMNFGNGDGIVFYPGRMPFYPEEDRGLTRILPSIRLKNMRRGQQDFELMWLAQHKVGRDKVLAMVKEIVPRGLDEVEMKDPVPWSQRGDDYDRVRNALLDIIVK
ncbi:MAG: DUF4091 domain-containing protein [Candidatus Glassbacteria bacterium]|nr:DUF4091 domain-containing protein [Candidatus Glassbacteria bacterium]